MQKSEALPPRPHSHPAPSSFEVEREGGGNVELLFFLPLLLLMLLICADARGGSLLRAVEGDSQHGLRNITLAALIAMFVAVLVGLAR